MTAYLWESKQPSTAHIELEISKAWMKQNPRLALNAVEDFGKQFSEAIISADYTRRGFITLHATPRYPNEVL